ncbi:MULTISPECIES: hypothetical protein [unclassified Cryobacterium]|uniref:hypothetical protein n=1 Tax=unclassified Cryobacterium TaxID=2649013 RepID=UPI0011AFF179|nr:MULTISPECIES: hypothetical protein [unclassified Cryobacterium]
MKKRLSVSVSALSIAGLLCLGASPAFADSPSYDQPMPQELLPTSNNTSIQVNGSSSKEDDSSTNATVVMDGTLSGYSQENITPPGGIANDITTGFASNVDFGGSLITAAVLNGQSYGIWHGTSPWTATSIKLTDTFWSTGVGVTASYPGANVSITGQSVTINNTVSNTRENRHYYSNLTFSGTLFTVNQEANTSFQFGSSFFNDYVD